MTRHELDVPHKLFLQRLMASAVLTDEEARTLHRQLNKSRDPPSDREFAKFLGAINSAMRPLIGCEIRTASLPHASASPPRGTGGTGSRSTKYHAFVNLKSDGPSKLYGAKNKNPHQTAMMKLILEHLVDEGNSDNPASPASSGNNDPGCRGALSRLELINLRTELTGPHEDKISLRQAEDTIRLFEDEKWLVPKRRRGGDDDGDGDDGGRDDEDEGASPSSRGSGGSGKKRGKRSSSRGGDDGDDDDGDDDLSVKLQIGPRTYMELPDLLGDLGVQMPQFILHGSA